MKTHTLIFIIAIGIAIPAIAQEPPQVNQGSSTLSKNFQITIKGSLGQSEGIDVVLRGNSRKFSTALQDPTRKIEIVLQEDEGQITVLYALFARIAVKVSDNNISYQDAETTGSFQATLGEPFRVLEVGDSSLTIQVDPATKTK
jgi:hypothetical protein